MFLDPRANEYEFVFIWQRDYSMVMPIADDYKVIAIRQYSV